MFKNTSKVILNKRYSRLNVWRRSVRVRSVNGRLMFLGRQSLFVSVCVCSRAREESSYYIYSNHSVISALTTVTTVTMLRDGGWWDGWSLGTVVVVLLVREAGRCRALRVCPDSWLVSISLSGWLDWTGWMKEQGIVGVCCGPDGLFHSPS